MPDLPEPPDAPDPDPGVPKISGKWVIVMVLIWPVIIYGAFVLMTR